MKQYLPYLIMTVLIVASFAAGYVTATRLQRKSKWYHPRQLVKKLGL